MAKIYLYIVIIFHHVICYLLLNSNEHYRLVFILSPNSTSLLNEHQWVISQICDVALLSRIYI